MEQDKRYQPGLGNEVPEALFKDVDGGYSIKDSFKEGRAAYLDMSSTTPLDPRVLDAMAPYMVRS
jgi:hypothetical protein